VRSRLVAIALDIALQKMGGERMPQRMRRDPAAEPRGRGRQVAGAVELAHRHRPERIVAWEQPASRPALQPPRSQKIQKLRRQHVSMRLESMSSTRSMTISPPPGSVGDAEGDLVLETRAGCRLEQPGDLIGSGDLRQLPRIVRADQLMGEVGAAECDGEEETQPLASPVCSSTGPGERCRLDEIGC
jgi:hypothetical protein